MKKVTFFSFQNFHYNVHPLDSAGHLDAMSAKEIQVSDIVKKLETERRLRKLQNNANTNDASSVDSLAPSSQIENENSDDDREPEPSGGASVLATAISKAAAERRKLRKASAVNTSIPTESIPPVPSVQGIPGIPQRSNSAVPTSTAASITPAPALPTAHSLFKKVNGKWVETGAATAFFETAGNGAGVTLDPTSGEEGSGSLYDISHHYSTVTAPATQQQQTQQQQQSQSQQPQQPQQLQQPQPNIYIAQKKTSASSSVASSTSQVSNYSAPIHSKAISTDSQLRELASTLDKTISSVSASSQSRRTSASTTKQTSALRKLDDMLKDLSFDLGETPEEFEGAPVPVPLASTTSAKKTATRKKSSATTSPHYSDQNIAPQNHQQPLGPSRPLGQRNTAATPQQQHQNQYQHHQHQHPHHHHHPYSARHIPNPETALSLSSIEQSNNSLLRPTSNSSGLSEESFSSGELPKSIFLLGSGPLSGGPPIDDIPLPKPNDSNRNSGQEELMYEDAGGRRETITGPLIDRMFEELVTPPLPVPALPTVVTKHVYQPDSLPQPPPSSTSPVDGQLPTGKRTGIRTVRPISRIDETTAINRGSLTSPALPVAQLRQQRDSSLRERPLSLLTGDRKSISPGTVQNMVKAMGGGSGLGGTVTVDESGMDSKATGSGGAGVEHSKGLNEHGYPTREPILEKTGKIGMGSYNFFISRAALYCTSQKDSSIYAGFPISLHHILGVSWENKKVVVTWYYAKPPPKREPRLTDLDIEFPDLFTNSQWAIKLLSAAFKGNHANEVLAKQAIFFVDQEDVKLVREILKDLIIPILEAAKKPFDIQLIDPEGLKNAIDRFDLQSINSITYLRTKNTSTKTFKLIDECLLAAAMKAKGRDMKQVKVLQPEMDAIEVALAVLKEPTQFGQFCVMNTIIKFEKGRVVKSKQKNRTR
ncbi:UNVERIFIED_CONTAM: hypothetical protein HDU68_000067 [Siphonaria sp. JEL0065]|nr:hypothetical protein HDU68_000067 [Siphonaria sp. JEL0065]